MKIRFTLLCLALSWLANYTVAADKPTSPRSIVSLNQGWEYRPMSTVKKNAPFTPVTIPHTWNVNFTEGTISYDRAMMVYRRSLSVTEEMKGKRLFLYFEGVNSASQVFVNHRTVGEHLGGYTAFCFEITDYVKPGENALEVWASNAYRTDVLPLHGDFNVYGGIHRPCHLIVTEQNCISPLFYASPGVFIHQQKVSKEKADVLVETMLSLKEHSSLAEGKANLTLKTIVTDADNKIITTNETKVTDSTVKQPIQIVNPILWNGKKNPYLYRFTVELYDGTRLIDRMEQRTGFRFMLVDADKGFFLNGEYLDIYGFCRHEDVAGKGSALLPDDYKQDMELIKESGATAMRLAHYPHAEPMYDLSDENGIVLWTEIPMCGPGGQDYTGYVSTEGFKQNARLAVKELVYQKYNHPSICFWGICNEILVSDGGRFVGYDDPVPFMKELNTLFKSIDTSRYTALATCVDQTYYLGCSDLIAWNKYFGWYNDAAPSAAKFFDTARQTANGQPVGVSEYGAGASIDHHQWPSEQEDRSDSRFHPEEAQSFCHEGNWEAFSERPFLWGKFIWVFADFQSYMRKEGDKDGINDKGLLTYDRRTKKDAFFFYKANWNPEPMLYITSRRYTKRTSPLTDIKVYSNLKEVTLYVNDKKVGKMKPDSLHRIVWKDIKLDAGSNAIRIEGKSGKQSLTDSCEWTLRGESEQ